MGARRTRPGASEVNEANDAGWIEVIAPTMNQWFWLLGRELHKGGAETIALAVERHPDVVFLDELGARRVANVCGLAQGRGDRDFDPGEAGEGVTSLREELDKLHTVAGFRIGDSLYRRALQTVAEEVLVIKMNTVQRIIRNTGVLLASKVVSYILGFFFVMYTARYLGAEGFDVLSFALAFTGVFGVFAGPGLGQLTARVAERGGLQKAGARVQRKPLSACSDTDRCGRVMTMHPRHSRPRSMRLAKDIPIPEVIT